MQRFQEWTAAASAWILGFLSFSVHGNYGVRSLDLAFPHDPTDGGVVQDGMLGHFLLAVVELLHRFADSTIPLRLVFVLVDG
ncbi:MAG: hypothetical protein NTV33_10810 [Coprothermobacterota bacterium]|nr:hypothetical protein [Coprothermobacterota bacterium]